MTDFALLDLDSPKPGTSRGRRSSAISSWVFFISLLTPLKNIYTFDKYICFFCNKIKINFFRMMKEHQKREMFLYIYLQVQHTVIVLYLQAPAQVVQEKEEGKRNLLRKLHFLLSGQAMKQREKRPPSTLLKQVKIVILLIFFLQIILKIFFIAEENEILSSPSESRGYTSSGTEDLISPARKPKRKNEAFPKPLPPLRTNKIHDVRAQDEIRKIRIDEKNESRNRTKMTKFKKNRDEGRRSSPGNSPVERSFTPMSDNMSYREKIRDRFNTVKVRFR